MDSEPQHYQLGMAPRHLRSLRPYQWPKMPGAKQRQECVWPLIMGCWLLWRGRKSNWERIWRTFWKEPTAGLCVSGRARVPGRCPTFPQAGPGCVVSMLLQLRAGAMQDWCVRQRQPHLPASLKPREPREGSPGNCRPSPQPSSTALGFKCANEGEGIKSGSSWPRARFQQLNCFPRGPCLPALWGEVVSQMGPRALGELALKQGSCAPPAEGLACVPQVQSAPCL